mmetsp:Transcript_7359/g.13952  ORF Transcript_7359/g.13952 Transcript_7359/m.13952 type:complete len:315 (+) Transcript_7359:186-1130(+)
MSAMTASWSSQLEKISRHLTVTSANVQAAFIDYSKKSQTEAKQNHDIIPLQDGADPINILKRISRLESNLVKLRDECEEFARQRPIVAQEVTDLILENFRSIEELTMLTKGRNASIDPNIRRLATIAHEQNQAWKNSHPRNSEDISEVGSFSHDNPDETENDSRNEEGNRHGYDHSYNHNLHTNTSLNQSSSFVSPSKGGAIISERQFQNIPIEKRGRSNLSRVQSVASMIYEETAARYLDGYRGRSLVVERSHLLKYAAAFPEMNTVLRDHALWRDIVSSLEYLGFVRVDHSDGSLFMTGLQASNDALSNSYS